MKKQTVFLLVLAICTNLLFGCSNENTLQETDSKDTAVSIETVDTAEETAAPEPDFAVPDYDGYSFRMLAAPHTDGTPSEIDVESETGESLNDAVYRRNMKLESELDIQMVEILSYGNVPAGEIRDVIVAGEDAYDAIISQVVYYAPHIIEGFLLDTAELQHIDPEKTYWNGGVIRDSAIAGREFLLFGDSLWSDKSRTWCLCFNKELLEANRFENPYELVREGLWTLDKLKEQCLGVKNDVDGNGEYNEKDLWGLLGSNTAGIGLVTSCGMITTESGKDGLTLRLGDESTVSILGEIHEFINAGTMMLRAEDIKNGGNIWDEIINVFREGRALYRISILSDVTSLRDMENDFGILPMPKRNENQQEYLTTYQGWNANAIAVPMTVKDPAQTGAILEYMSYYSTDTILKAYYDITLQRKVSRDNDSAEMLDLIFSSVTTDIALAMEFGGIRPQLVSMINSGDNTIASSIASIKVSIQNELNTLFDSVKNP